MIVLDAPVLVQALIGREMLAERAYWIATAREPLPLSTAVQTAVVDILARPFLSRYLTPGLVAEALGALRARAQIFEPRVAVTECRDPKDNRYLELALAAGASAIVSQDEDLLSLQSWRGVRFMRPARLVASGGDF